MVYASLTEELDSRFQASGVGDMSSRRQHHIPWDPGHGTRGVNSCLSQFRLNELCTHTLNAHKRDIVYITYPLMSKDTETASLANKIIFINRDRS